MKYINLDTLHIPKGFFDEVDNVPKLLDWLHSQEIIEIPEESIQKKEMEEIVQEGLTTVPDNYGMPLTKEFSEFLLSKGVKIINKEKENGKNN